MLVMGFPTGWGRRVGEIGSRRCGEKQLEQWVMCAVVAVLRLLLPLLERETRSRQLMSKVVQVAMALSVCFASLLILFLVVMLHASWEKGRWRGTLGRERQKKCPTAPGL